VLPKLTDAAVTVKLIQVPAVTVWFPGTVNVGRISACALTVTLAEMLAVWEGEDESVSVSVTVNA
jgi:hypothetical protein